MTATKRTKTVDRLHLSAFNNNNNKIVFNASKCPLRKRKEVSVHERPSTAINKRLFIYIYAILLHEGISPSIFSEQYHNIVDVWEDRMSLCWPFLVLKVFLDCLVLI